MITAAYLHKKLFSKIYGMMPKRSEPIK